MRLLCIGTLACLLLYGKCSNRKLSTGHAMDITGPWNVESYYARDSSYNFNFLNFFFDTNGSCVIPGRAGLDFVLEDGYWNLLDSNRINLEVNDTLFNGVWSIENIEYSKVAGYSNTILSMTICHENRPLCFTLYRKYQP
jgi:hypothetical protein